MTSRDIQLIAKTIKECACVSQEDVALAFAEAIATINERFDKDKFIKTCEIEGRKTTKRVKIIINFNGGHNREGIIDIRDEDCLVCKERKLCLFGDSSDEEYVAITICRGCIEELFRGRRK